MYWKTAVLACTVVAAVGCESPSPTSVQDGEALKASVPLLSQGTSMFAVSMYGYTMGPNGEIFDCPKSALPLQGSVTYPVFVQLTSTTSAVTVVRIDWKRDRVIYTPECHTPYVGGSVGLSVWSGSEWNWIGSYEAKVQENFLFEIPEGGSVMVTANPEPGYAIHEAPGFTVDHLGRGTRIFAHGQLGSLNGLNIGFRKLPPSGGSGGGGEPCDPNVVFICGP